MESKSKGLLAEGPTALDSGRLGGAAATLLPRKSIRLLLPITIGRTVHCASLRGRWPREC